MADLMEKELEELSLRKPKAPSKKKKKMLKFRSANNVEVKQNVPKAKIHEYQQNQLALPEAIHVNKVHSKPPSLLPIQKLSAPIS